VYGACTGSESQLSIGNKLLLYKSLNQYGLVQLWGTASDSNVQIIQRFQNKYLNVPWYVTNDTLHRDLNVPYVGDEIKKLGQRYADRMEERSSD